MSHDHGGDSETPTPMRALRRAGGVTLEDRLENIEKMLQILLDAKGTLDNKVSLIESRMELHDKILMGAGALVGVTVLVAALSRVVH